MGPEGDSTTEPQQQLVQELGSTSSSQTRHHRENGVQRIWGKQSASDKKIDSLRIHEIQPFAIDTAVRKIWELQRNTNETFAPYLSVDVTKKLRKIVLDTLEKCTPTLLRELSYEIPDPQIVQQLAEQKQKQSQSSASERQARAEAAKKAKEERLRKMREKREAAAKEAKDTTASSTPPEAQPEPSLDESEQKTSPEPNPTEPPTESPEIGQEPKPDDSLTETKSGDDQNSPPVDEQGKPSKLSVRERVALANASATANRRRPIVTRSAEARTSPTPVPAPVGDCKPSFFRPSQIKTNSPVREPRDTRGARETKPIYVINSPEKQNADSTSEAPHSSDPTSSNSNSNSNSSTHSTPAPSQSSEPIHTGEPSSGSPIPITPAQESKKPELKPDPDPKPDSSEPPAEPVKVEEQPAVTKPARPALTRPSGKGTFVRPTLSRPTAGGKLPVIKPKASEAKPNDEDRKPESEPSSSSEETKPPTPQIQIPDSDEQPQTTSQGSDEALFLSVSADAHMVPTGRRASLGQLKKFESLPAIQRKAEKDERTLAAMRAFANSRKGGFAPSPIAEDDSVPKITVTKNLADAVELHRIIEELIHQEFSSEVPIERNPGPLEFFHASVKGPRPANEDEYAVIEHYNDLFGLPDDAGKYSFAAVYDGHCGKYSSLYVRSQLHYAISNHPEFFSNIDKAIFDSFLHLDQLVNEVQERDQFSCGTTALSVWIRDQQELIVANVGDCRGFLARSGAPLEIAAPHLPSREDEKQRIKANGGAVVKHGTWRVNGSLAVSRSIGDVTLKKWVIPDPDVTRFKLESGDEFLILASDGLWDVVSPQEALDMVSGTSVELGRQHVCKKLCDVALSRNSNDNVTVVVVFFGSKSS